MTIPAIEVKLWGRRVGAVAPDPALGCYVFAYAKDWIATGIEPAPLTMPLGPRRYAFPDLPEATYRGLPGLLADALPDDFGNAIVDAWMATRGIQRATITALDRLAYMGKRGMGALEFRPALRTPTAYRAALDMRALVEAARYAVHGDLSQESLATEALQNIAGVGTSAGGARAKAVVAWNPATGEIRSGQFATEPGFEHWLLKFDGMGKDAELGGSRDYGRIEYAYALMAQSAGIHMMPSRLLLENGRAHFMTQRFDRTANRKHHVQTLCGLAHIDYRKRGTHAYEQLFSVAKQLGLPVEDIDELFRRMVFNVMAKNCDDHAKNFAFILKEGESWRLAPAYDVTHAYNPAGEWTYQHLLSVNGKFRGIGDADCLALADRFMVRRARDTIDHVRHAVRRWPEFAAQAGLPYLTTERVASDFVSPIRDRP